jgi:hypothetical protein
MIRLYAWKWKTFGSTPKLEHDVTVCLSNAASLRGAVIERRPGDAASGSDPTKDDCWLFARLKFSEEVAFNSQYIESTRNHDSKDRGTFEYARE